MHLKCFYTNACSMRNEQEVPKAVAQSQRFDIIVISETWWDEPCDWSALLDAYTLFKWDLVDKVEIGGRLSHRDDKAIEFIISVDRSARKISPLDMRRTDFSLLGEFLSNIEEVHRAIFKAIL
ncbi:hypothetical protein TURU_168642 [Turdus rufiventris]|nr:hypothetical protein TURU_168642 [Turdus rufiventris]